ncbi:1-phosphatidylinositol 4,5-bisphosphate phosphodiesterase classes I and II [Chironomus tepperi]|uniref:1-phosphatidylinositol 4,5-bisphosphate phosphodiesterase classes I and II n=1 Tax=Chironomus tepperi TaxID=113505 RepID=UPI00391EF6C9
MATSALTTATASALTSTLPDAPKSAQQSPRNTANHTSTVAVQTGVVEVSKTLLEGEKFIKWDEDSGLGTPVTLKIDKQGFYLYWIDQNHEMDLLDIASIRDVRTGQYAKKPKDLKLRQIVTMGSQQDTLEEKTVTLCYGSDFVNVNFINFCCTRKDIAQHWCDELLKLAYNLTQLNGSATRFLQKAHVKLCLQVDKSGKIPVKNIMKLFASHKDDRRRVEKALEISGLPIGKTDSISIQKLQFEDFFNLYKNLTMRTEVEKLFDEIVGTSKRRIMSITQLVDFLNKIQRDPRLNEILFPYANPARAKDIIQQYEPNKFNAQKGLLSFDGFLRYLMSEDNPIMASNKLELCDDMDQPLSHYFINSSHNTYLIGHQITGKSSVEIYRQTLLAGCRCVELDFWNGRTEEPVIVHGYTFVPEIYAKDVLEAIAESAFKTSDYPVILSFENHCNPRQQAKIANYCRDIFGDMLLDLPLDSHPLEPFMELPSPQLLKRKIIIKNKKKHHHHHHHHHHKKSQNQATNALTLASDKQQLITTEEGCATGSNNSQLTGNGDISQQQQQHHPPLQQFRQASKESTGSSDTDSSSDDESIQVPSSGPPEPTDKVQNAKETEAGAEISALVNYVQPVHFSSFENSEKKGRFYEMSSFDEKQATALLKERPIEFVNYNKHQLSRVYPAGYRFDSSNFMPQLFWNCGCQLVALNYQTLDLGMQLNLGIYEYNQRCGYLLKPEFMRRKDRRLDPFAESTVDGIIAGTVSITVLSGQFLTDKKVGTYVEVDMYGLPADTVRKKFRTRIVRENSINPVYGDDPFVFKKVVLPQLASIRIAAYEENGKFLGHHVLPVIGLCPGYRHVSLRNELGQPLPLATLFLCIIVKDYVPDGLSDFAEALANPIKYQSDLEKRSQQLAVLQEDMEPNNDDGEICKEQSSVGTLKKDIKPSDTATSSPKHRSNFGPSTIHSTSAIETNLAESFSNIDSNFISSSLNINIGPNSAVPNPSQINESSKVATLPRLQPETVSNEADVIIAETLEKIFEHKSIREKREALEKKIRLLKKNHDKKKIEVVQNEISDGKKSSINKLVKKLSSKNMDVNIPVPPCPLLTNNEDSSNERLLNLCREHALTYRELLEKYHEQIFTMAENQLHKSQENQMQHLKKLMEKETNEVMRQLQHTRKSEVKQLALVHKDKDELERMKREVASTVVEKGVAERVRLTANYDKRRDDLQKQHDIVRATLLEQKEKIKSILEKDVNSQACASTESIMNFFNALIPPTTSTSSVSLSTEATATTNDMQAGTNCFKN